MLEGKTVGFALTGSFCTFKTVISAMEALKKTNCKILPIMSEMSYSTDTRFGAAKDFRDLIENICGAKIIHTISEAEPIGPKKLLDLMIIAPCTGNTLAKLAVGIADTSVTLGAKAHLRNSRPLLVGVSTNDGLANAAKNIGVLHNNRNYFFIPYSQDDCIGKPNSLVADFSQTTLAAEAALSGIQLQPMLR